MVAEFVASREVGVAGAPFFLVPAVRSFQATIHECVADETLAAQKRSEALGATWAAKRLAMCHHKGGRAAN